MYKINSLKGLPSKDFAVIYDRFENLILPPEEKEAKERSKGKNNYKNTTNLLPKSFKDLSLKDAEETEAQVARIGLFLKKKKHCSPEQ